jgi:hypothetical protein
VLHDRTARLTYLLTKLAVFVVAAALTWPLSKVVGPKAWWGLGVFGLLMLAMTVVVLLASARGGSSPVEEDPETEPDEAFDPEAPIELPIEDAIDLHPFPPRDIPRVVEDYLEAAYAKGFREVRLIHGRGVGVQRERTRSVLSKHPLVASYHDAPPARGGWGATVVYLLEESTVDS